MNELKQFQLNMYNKIPENTATIKEITEMAQERLIFYQMLQQLDNTSEYEEYSRNWCNLIEETIKKAGLGNYDLLLKQNGSFNDLQKAFRADSIAHWILRVAYCDTTSLRQLFLTNEIKWFKLRLKQMNFNQIKEFIENNNYKLQAVEETNNENKILLQQLKNLCVTEGSNDIVFYKVKYFHALKLVKKRKYLLRQGFLYFPSTALDCWLEEEFQRNLRKDLKYASKCKNHRLDERLANLLNDLHLVQPQLHRIGFIEPISLDDLDKESELNYPICMRYLHEKLREENHLKYFCRMQYGLFLKALGLTLEASLQFWRNEFIKRMPEERFWKRYSYLFRHQYGTVGGMIDYPSYNCDTIIERDVGIKQYQGCPFKHWNELKLAEKLKEYGVDKTKDINEILELKRKKRYKIACSKCFECRTGLAPDEPIRNPNQYFNNSYRINKFFSKNVDIEDIFLD